MALLNGYAKDYLAEVRRLHALDREPTNEEVAGLVQLWARLDTTQRKRVSRRLMLRKLGRNIASWFGSKASSFAEEELRKRLP